ncbi:MAG: tRNA-intron lyase [Candidatus Njordarchaeales archaeon]
MKNMLLKGLLIDSTKVIIDKKTNPYWRAFLANGYGEDEGEYLALRPVEALYLLDFGRLILYKDSKEINYDEAFQIFSQVIENLWQYYVIYRDLRTRGFLVITTNDKLLPFEVFPRGVTRFESQPFAAVIIAESFRAIKLEELAYAIEKCKEKNLKLLIAIIDELGDVTYYLVEEALKAEATLKIFRSG